MARLVLPTSLTLAQNMSLSCPPGRRPEDSPPERGDAESVCRITMPDLMRIVREAKVLPSCPAGTPLEHLVLNFQVRTHPWRPVPATPLTLAGAERREAGHLCRRRHGVRVRRTEHVGSTD